jgi:hypothetical protein
MVMEVVPVGVFELVEIFRVDMKVGVPEDGLKLAVASDGRPEADKLTDSLKPPEPVTEMATIVDPPGVTEIDAGLELIVNAGGATDLTIITICGMC